MLYFDLAVNKEDLLTEKDLKKPKAAQTIIYNYRKFQLVVQDISGKKLVVLPKINKRILRKVDKLLNVNVEKNICVSEELKAEENFMNFVNSKDINVLNGRWLFKYMAEEVIVFISNQSKFQLESQEISILTNENSNFIFETIMKLSLRVKNINIITKKPNDFKKLGDKVYEENGLILRITNDFKKSALKSHIILNLNFDEQEISKINFEKNSVIVNFENQVKINSKKFAGKIINFYHINLPEKYKQGYEKFKNFDDSIFYESVIYKRTLTKNIWKEIKDDKVEIDSL